MLYFKITVLPLAHSGEQSEPAEALAHVVVDDVDIESAASRVVKRLHAEKWRISAVHRAFAIGRDERFVGNEIMTQLLHGGRETGFAFLVEPPSVRGEMAEFPHARTEIENLASDGVSA